MLFTISTPSKCAKCPKMTTARFALASGGLCPSCLKQANTTPRVCASCNKPFLWHTRFAEVVGHPATPQQVCPTCADMAKRGDDSNQPIISDRKALHEFPVVRVDLDMEGAVLCDPEGKAQQGRNPARRLVLKDSHGRSYEGRCDIYDYRPDGSRGVGSLARLRVMEATHDRPRTLTVQSGSVLGAKHEEVLTFDATYQYLVLEPVATSIGLPVARLIAARYHQKSALKGGKSASGGVTDDQSLWSRHLTSSSRSGAHGGGTLVAVVDNLHPVTMRQDHLLLKWDMDGEVPDEAGFRAPDGGLTPSVFVPGADVDLVEAVRAQGFPAKTSGDATFIGLNKVESGWAMPEGLPDSFVLRLEAAESGGGMTNTGHSVVICGHRGEALRPFATSGHRGQQACGTHAWFGRTGGLCTVSASYWSKAEPSVTVTIVRHVLNVDGFMATLASEQLWTGSPRDLPRFLAEFRSAVEAAARKATDYHCRSVHFAAP